MKKTFRLIGMAIMAVLFSVSLTACGHDDDPDDPTNHDRDLIGTWTHTESGNYWTETASVTFKTDGTYTDVIEYSAGNNSESWTASGTWSTNNGILTICMLESSDPDDEDDLGESESVRYKVEGNKLYLYDGGEPSVLTKK
ncbi:MAG: hypothetical protein K2L83_01940 [Muribaculaceae bacterium]|nr:hypothetical protein [Muribaculaceae bacterium]